MFRSSRRDMRTRLVRLGAAAVAGMALLGAGLIAAKAETRTLKIYHVHLQEKTEITFKKNGRYLPDGLKKANWALRDWRKNKPTNMDPRLLDLIWEAYQQSGSKEYINVIGGFRSPETNAMLRSRSAGVAEKSQHMLGKAMDFYIPGVPLKKLREIGLKMQIGGVGFYPRSGSPFVHFDVGNGRHWPRMSRKELLAVFPKGNTIHVPSDGKPLPGYELALASYKKRKGSDSIQVANVGDRGSTRSRGSSGRTLLAALFGGGSEEAEDTIDAVTAPVETVKPAKIVPAKPVTPEPAVQVASVQPVPAKRPGVLPAGLPMPDRDAFDTTRAPVPPAEVPAEVEVASLAPSRIPVPVHAPVRTAAPAVAAEPMPVTPTPAVLSDTLVAAVDAAPAPIPSAQLAYSVPTPANRPPFEVVLKPAQTAVSSVLPSALPIHPKPQPEVASVDALIAALDATPESFPASPGQNMLRSVAFPSTKPTVAASLVALPKETHTQARSGLVAAIQPPAPRPAAKVDAVSPTGKAGRVSRATAVPAPRPRSVELGTPAASRIEVASLVTDPELRAEGAYLDKPNARSLVTSVPSAVFTSGFVRSRGVPVAAGRFSGSAVQFLPVLKLN